jgi:RNA polymerase sigma-70 factor (family 1)
LRLGRLYNEEDLLVRVSQGDEKAFTELFHAYHQALGAYIIKITKSHNLAQEIVQDVFMKMWTKRFELDRVKDFNAYLFVTSRNQALNALRNEVRYSKIYDQLDVNLLPHYSEDPNSDLSLEGYYVLIDKAILTLPPQQQKVYLLSRKEGLKHEQIAELLQLSRETVKRHISLALVRITSYVKAHAEILTVALMIFCNKIMKFF